MRSKGSRFTLGVWGLRVCSLDVAFVVATIRNRSQPFATVRTNSVWPCLWEVLQRLSFLDIFGGFQCVVASFRVASVALRDIQTCSATCRKSFCVAGAILLRRFQKMCCSFRGRRSTLDVSIVIFRGRRSTLDVSCCVFLQIALAGLRQVATKCKFRGRRGILCDVLKIDGSLARNIDFEVANFRVLRKTRRKTSILKLQSVKIGGSLARNARFGAPTCLVLRLRFAVASPCLWGKLQNLSFCHVANRENWRKSRTKCLFFCIHVSCLESLVFLWRRRVYGGSWKTYPFRMFPSRVSCCFAWQTWHFLKFQPV